MQRSLVQLSPCVLLLLSVLAAACEGPQVTYGESSVTIRPPSPEPAGEGGAAGVPLAGTAAGDGIAGDIAIDVPTGGTTAEPPEPIDAGMAMDAGDAGPTELPPSFCGRIPEALLDPGRAGDGSFSGCPQKICESSTPLEGTDLAPYLPVMGVGAAAAPYEGCTRINGDVLLNFTPHADLEKLSCLERVEGSLVILNTAGLKVLTGLDSLLHVAHDLRIARLDDAFADANSLESLDALSSLRSVGGSLALRTPYVTSLSGLQSLRAVGGHFVLDLPVELDNLSGARSLVAIGGDLRIAGTVRFTSLDGLNALETIGGSLELTGNAGIPIFYEALPKVTCIGGAITVEEPNPFHEALDLLPALERVGGMISIKDHPLMRSVTMLKNVRYIAGSIHVHNNESLEHLDLSSLEAIDGFLWVVNNPYLEECPLIELADSLGAGALSEIHDNSRVLRPDCRLAFRTP